ncbi:hypothetical protein PsYK624_130940 [Phanerochaete sordida]|uniref:Uncharacterized protein n=1 Tax=Phanerochaete sordida TaxID=48140 RepID=A0A9P3GLD5_9APHY|nr:hypothetical protein PsYK624_130940 [Phanerochaete sordida]
MKRDPCSSWLLSSPGLPSQGCTNCGVPADLPRPMYHGRTASTGPDRKQGNCGPNAAPGIWFARCFWPSCLVLVSLPGRHAASHTLTMRVSQL